MGSPTHPIGLLTISDVWRYLDGFAHAFVLLREIETGLRQFIELVLANAGRDLADVLAAMPDFDASFHQVNDIRNATAHFRVALEPVSPSADRNGLEPLRVVRRWVEERVGSARHERWHRQAGQND